jgi:hypothetical protein
MNRRASLCIGLLMLCGCSQQSRPELTPQERSLQAVLNKGDRLKGEANQKMLQEAVAKFKTANGRNPESLNEMVKNGVLKEIPVPPQGKKFAYYPQTGKVEIVRADSAN